MNSKKTTAVMLAAILALNTLLTPMYIYAESNFDIGKELLKSDIMAIDDNGICTSQNQLKDLDETQLTDFLERYFEAMLEVDELGYTTEDEIIDVLIKHGIDIIDKNNYNNGKAIIAPSSYRAARINKDCAWAVTKSVAKIGLLIGGVTAVNKLKTLADALGSVKEAVQLIVLAIKGGDLASYTKWLPSDTVRAVQIALGWIVNEITGFGEIREHCF